MKIAERYEVIKSIGQGGWGEVFLVLDGHNNEKTHLALKLSHSNLPPGELLQFKQEFYLLSHLSHSHILKVHDFGETDEAKTNENTVTPESSSGPGNLKNNRYYFTMEYVEGRKFNQYFAPRFAKGLGEGFYDALIQTLSTLHFIHQKGWIHSDLKPANLLMTKENQVKLLDFGFAKHPNGFNGQSGLNLREPSNDFKGTLGYVAPEIIKGEWGDPRSDLYSLGVLLYETLTHRLPFDGDSPLKIIRSQLEMTPATPSQVNSHIPTPLSEIVMKLLQRDPGDRYRNAEEVIEALQPLHPSICITDSRLEDSTTPRLFTPPLIAREKEVSEFQILLKKAKEGFGILVILSGERGVGKSRLLQEFKFQGQLEGFQVLTGIASDKEKRTFHPLRQILSQLPVEETLPFDRAGTSGRSPLPEEAEKWRIFDEVTNLFLEHPRPLVLMIDDFHLADPLAQDLTAFLARSVCKSQSVYESARIGQTHELKDSILIVVAYESAEERMPETFLEGTKEIENLTKIELKSLSPEETGTFYSHLLGIGGDEDRGEITSPLQEAMDWLFQQTGGIPLLIEETTRWLVTEKILERKGRKWFFHKELLMGREPSKEIEGLISQTLSRLDETLKTLLEESSVIGDRFSAQLLKGLTSLTDNEIIPLLNHLEREHILRKEPDLESHYAFSHHWLREILYERINPDLRKEIHRKILKFLEREPLDGNVIALSHHAYLGDDNEKFLEYGKKAGKIFEESCNHKRALELYEKLIPLFKEKEERLELLENLGDINERIGEYEKSLTHYQTSLEMEKRIKNSSSLYLKIGTVERKRSRYPEALSAFEKGLSLLKEKQTSEGMSLLNGLGWVYREQGEYEKAKEILTRAERMAQEIDDREGLAQSLRNLATVFWNQSNYKEAIAVGKTALSTADGIQDEYQIAATCNNLGIFHWNVGELNDARSYYLRSLEIRKKIGDMKGIGLTHHNLGLLDQAEGKWEEASQYFEKSLDIFERLNDLVNISRLHNSFGLIYHHTLGRWDKALEHYQKSLKLFIKLEDKLEIVIAYQNLGYLYLCKGELHKAKENLEFALTISEKIGSAERVAISLLNLAMLEKEKEDWSKLELFLERAGKIYKEKEIKRELSLYLQTLSLLHLKRQEIEKALQFTEEGLKIAIEQKDEAAIGSSHRTLGMVFSENGEDKKAMENFSKSIEIFERINNRFELAIALLESSRFHLSQWQKTHHTDNFQSACDNLKRAEMIFRELGAKGQLEKVHALTSQLISQLSSKPLPFGREDQLKTLYEASQVINSILDLKTLLGKVMDLVINLLKAERGVLLLKENGNLRVAAGKNMDNTTIRDASELSKSILDQVTEEGNPVISFDAHTDPRFQERESVILNNIHSLLCVPMKTQTQIIGTIYVDSRITSHLFTEEDQAFLSSLSNLIAVAIENARYHDHLKKESQNLRREVKSLYSHKNIIGNTKKIEDLRNLIEQSASSDSTVLIMGETGTGKELVAKAIHYQSQRNSKIFLPLVCGSVPESLLESELFGHKKGSFTGATNDAEGIFESANGGTIFLDEIGDAPLPVQVKLLRVLEEGEIRRVGDTAPRKVDVRVICATNKNLIKEVETGRFRQDLFFRINVILISISPLRERKEDIPLLAQHFLTLYSEKARKTIKGFSQETMDYLLKYPWPGNVRELENYIERAVVIAKDEMITPNEIYPALKIQQPKALSLSQSLMEAERNRIEEALTRASGNISRAAEELGLHRQQLQRVMKRLQITKEMFKNR